MLEQARGCKSWAFHNSLTTAHTQQISTIPWFVTWPLSLWDPPPPHIIKKISPPDSSPVQKMSNSRVCRSHETLEIFFGGGGQFDLFILFCSGFSNAAVVNLFHISLGSWQITLGKKKLKSFSGIKGLFISLQYTFQNLDNHSLFLLSHSYS